MTEKSKPVEQEITLRDLIGRLQLSIRFLLKKWKVILLCVIIGLALGVAYALLNVPEYVATTTFVTDTEENGGAGISAYAGLAARFGLDMGLNNGGNGLFSGDNIYDLMETRRMLQNTLLSVVTIDGKKDYLINKYIEVENLKKKWENRPFRTGLSFDMNSTVLTRSQNKVIAEICKLIIKKNLDFPLKSKAGSSSSLMAVTFTSKNEQLSALFLTNLVNNVAKYYVNTVTQKARASLGVLSKQLDSVRTQLYGAMSSVASFQDKNFNLIRQQPRVQQQKSSLRMDVNSAIYQQLVTAVETAKMNLQKETPLFEIVDSPVLPLEKRRPSLIICIVLGAFLGGVCSCLMLLANRFYKRLMTPESD